MRGRLAPAPLGRSWRSQVQIPLPEFRRVPVLRAFPDDLSILPDGDEAAGVALLGIRIRLALEIETWVALPSSRQTRSGRPGAASCDDRSVPWRSGHSRPARHDNRTLPVHWGMPVNAAKTCRIRWQAGRLRCRRGIFERRPAIVAEARYAHGCSSFGRTSPIVMVKPARAGSSHKARLRVAPSPFDAMKEQRR